MTTQQKVLTYAVGFVLGCLVLAIIPRDETRPGKHPWHQQTALEGTYPMELTDDMGRRIRLERQPRHIISLAPSITEMIFAMGLGDHLMAVTKWCDYPEEAKALRDAGAHVGTIDQPNRETIAAYRPDLIIGTDLTPPEIYSAIENPPGTVAIALRHDSMDDVLEDIGVIGKVMGIPGAALRLISNLQAQRASVDQRLQAYRQLPPVRVLFLLSIEESGQPGWAPGQNTWVNDLLVSANCRNLAAELGKSWGEVSFEALLSLNPEVVLIRDGDTQAARSQVHRIVDSLGTHPIWKQVDAVQNNRVHILDHGPLNIPGPRIFEAYRLVSEAVWPSQSAQIP